MAVVLPTMTTTSDLGLLAMVIRIAATEVAGRDRLFDKGALLGISIEREVMTERLRRSNVDLATFSQAMAHDLRNSVATISMWASVARARGAAGEEAQSLLRIMDQVKHVAGYAGDLVADLLRFAEAAPGSAPRVPVDLNLAAGRSLATLEAEITERHAVVETRDLPTVLGTFSDLELVLRHLIDNAIRHGGNPMPLVRLEAELDGPAWTIRCSDNGHGIPARLRDRVFEPLARGDRDSAGSGLGLATCRRIVEGLGGRIWIVASGRQGTTIAFCLPSTPERRSTSGTAGAVTGGLGTGRGPG